MRKDMSEDKLLKRLTESYNELEEAPLQQSPIAGEDADELMPGVEFDDEEDDMFDYGDDGYDDEEVSDRDAQIAKNQALGHVNTAYEELLELAEMAPERERKYYEPALAGLDELIQKLSRND